MSSQNFLRKYYAACLTSLSFLALADWEFEQYLLFVLLLFDFPKRARLIFCSKAMSFSSKIIARTARMTSGIYTEKKTVADENMMSSSKLLSNIIRRQNAGRTFVLDFYALIISEIFDLSTQMFFYF